MRTLREAHNAAQERKHAAHGAGVPQVLGPETERVGEDLGAGSDDTIRRMFSGLGVDHDELLHAMRIVAEHTRERLADGEGVVDIVLDQWLTALLIGAMLR